MHFTREGDPQIDFDRVSQPALERLNTARERAGIPFKITSTYRTPEHSIEVGGLNNDAHTKDPCTAFDIAYTNTYEAFLIIEALIASGFTRIGINPKNHHVHADNEDSLPTPRFWVEGEFV